MKPAKLVLVAGAITVYSLFPAYRYYLIGSWVVYKIIKDKPGRYRVIPKGSKTYKELIS